MHTTVAGQIVKLIIPTILFISCVGTGLHTPYVSCRLWASPCQGIGIEAIRQNHSIHIHSPEASIPIQLTLF